MRNPVRILFVVTALCAAAANAQKAQRSDLLRYADPLIGTMAPMLQPLYPVVQRPHAFARVEPAVSPDAVDWYVADHFYGMLISYALVMPVSSDVATDERGPHMPIDHDREIATPAYYSLSSEGNKVRVETTTAARTYLLRFTYHSNGRHAVAFSMHPGWSLRAINDHELIATGPALRVLVPLRRPVNATVYLKMRSLTAIAPETLKCRTGATALVKAPVPDQQTCEVEFASSTSTAELRIAQSFINQEQATRTLHEEVDGRTFEQVRAQSERVWNDALGKIRVEGGTERQRRIFYTSLYRSLLRMQNITEDGRYYSGFDQQIHSAGSHDFYVEDGLWDTYRSMHPLQQLIEPRAHEDMVRSYVTMYQQSGWMPSFPNVNGEMPAMLGHHAAPLIADAYFKGFRDFYVEAAYQGLRKGQLEATNLPWRRGPATPLDEFYQKNGYMPALATGQRETYHDVDGFEKRQASSVTLEGAYDDWCVGRLAAALGHTQDAALFLERAHKYALLFNQKDGFIEGKTADGQWLADFDPRIGGGQGGRQMFAEVNSWIETFNVQHDPAGLIALMGGREKFVAKLDQLFREPYGVSRHVFIDRFPDMTGLIGMYAQGNEPSIHIPYLYIFAGQPWKTQQRVRQILDVEYKDAPLGYPGDEDGGALSSWYVLSALGFYPECPGSPVYELTSPIFTRSVMQMGGGKTLTISAPNASARNKYIQSAMLNGKPLTKAWFSHAAIAHGGTLVLQLGPEPNFAWGSAESDAPPSLSK